MKGLKVFLAGDHAGFKHKEKIKKHLEKKNIPHEDFGPFKYNSKDDYPDFVIPMCEKVAKTKNSRGIIMAGSGQGEVIAANKVKGIRAVVIYRYNSSIIRLSRQHNDSNVLSLGSRFLTEKEVIKTIELWLKTPFPGAKRHKRRIKKLAKYEK
jgi:ribose 5-phosphate isomerase B